MYFYIKDGVVILESEKQVNIACDQMIQKESKNWVSYIFEDWVIKEYESSRIYLSTYKVEWKDKRIQELVKENEDLSKKYDQVLVWFNDVLSDSWLSKEPSNKVNKIKDYSLDWEPSNDFERTMLETRALLLNKGKNA